jgi:hypothetical protein
MSGRSLLLVLLACQGHAAAESLSFGTGGWTNYGTWSGEVRVSPAQWRPGDTVTVDATLWVTAQHLQNLTAIGIKPDSLILLATAERSFDAGGRLRLPNDQNMSTLITPTGLPIEGGPQGAVTSRFGGPFRTPYDQFGKAPAAMLGLAAGSGRVMFHLSGKLPDDLPPGIYRVRLDPGVAVGTRNYNLNGETFAGQSFFRGSEPVTYVYSPPIPADGTTVEGMEVSGASIQPRIPWVLLANYNSNGYYGVVADEDKPHFAISPRHLIQDEVILPRYDGSGKALTYSLEPQFKADTIDDCQNIPWDYTTGEITVEVTSPDGSVTPLGTLPWVRQNGKAPTTGRPVLTAWTPPAYGQYAVTATGWIQDIWGNRYEGGGTYRFWIAKRMTLATATFQGMPYPVGGIYGRDLGFAPAVPADVTVTATLYPGSDPSRAKTMTWGGKANAAGVFGALQGNKSLPLSEPGEYAAQVLATYTDADGHLWVSTMRHAGVVYDSNGPIVARGKKLYTGGKYLDRGETHTEGYIDSQTGTEKLEHINFPYNPGDVLLIASDGQGANKIIPTMTYEWKEDPKRDDAALNSIGATNLQLKTSNGYSPHMFPEFITDWAYYYGAAARPGFVSRFVVGETMVRAPYWSVSPNSFGGQINAHYNGDMPGDIYRLMGGVVLRRKGEAPLYAGYIASSFLLPRNEKNNRVIAPGSEDLLGSTGRRARVFLVGPRPGMTYPAGTTFGAALQIDPILPVNLTFTLKYPDGRTGRTSGTSDAVGSFVGKDRFVLDTPGVYRFSIEGEWEGHPASMPGLPAEGGEIYVLDAKPPDAGAGIEITTADGATFDPVQGIHIVGRTTADSVRFAAVMPGAVLAQGDLTVANGQFDFYFNPTDLHERAETYDVTNRVSGKAELGDVVHLTFFSREKGGWHSFARVIVRGNVVRVAR